MNKLFIILLIIGFFINCKSNQSGNINNEAQIKDDSILSNNIDENIDLVSQFNQLRLAIISQNPKQIIVFFDFPLTDDQAKGIEDVLNFTSSNKIDGNIILENDFEKNIKNIFDKNVINALTEISLDELKQNKMAVSKVFHVAKENTDYSVYVSIDDAKKTIQLSVNATYPPTDDNEEAFESAAIYSFKFNKNKQLKFDQVLYAG
ncbi:MAG: hypothetical protein IPK18_02105 [Sphingobacteriales bacterium]|jgi:adenylate kinase family enzyme|nr:MAG: hypothetical protein IPK18_02105 [Sphingobacteriales bacterium]